MISILPSSSKDLIFSSPHSFSEPNKYHRFLYCVFVFVYTACVPWIVASRFWHKRTGMWSYSTEWRRRVIGRLSTSLRWWRSATMSSSICWWPFSSKAFLPRYVIIPSQLILSFDSDPLKPASVFFSISAAVDLFFYVTSVSFLLKEKKQSIVI